MIRSTSNRRAALALAAILAAVTLAVMPRAADAEGVVRTVCPAAGVGCDHSSIQSAIDASAPGDTVLVRPGTYRERLVIDVASLLVCSGSVAGSSCSPNASLVTVDAGGASPATSIVAPDVTVAGLGLRSQDADVLVLIAAQGAMLRRNVLAGDLALAGGTSGVTVDARLNDWQTNAWSVVRERIDAGANRVLAAPLVRGDGRQDPPRPSVNSASHCQGAGFTPRFYEEAIWCAHAGGRIVLHPSANAVTPTPYVPVEDLNDGTPGHMIFRNRSISGVDAIGEPIWGAGFAAEALDGLTLCGGASATSSSDPPPPNPLTTCDTSGSNRARTIVDTSTTSNTVLDVAAADVLVQDLTFRHTGAPTGDVTGIDLSGVAGPRLLDNAIQLQGGGCTPSDISQGRCRGSGPFVTGITAAPQATDVTIEGNTIAADAAAADGSIGGTNGILASFSTANIEGNTFRAWGANAAYLTGGSGIVLAANTFETNGDGVLACAPGVQVLDNVFRAHLGAILPCAAGLIANANDFSNGNVYGVRVVGATGLAVDATRNHWGRYTRESVAAHVQPGSGNEIDVSCFLGPSGAEICPPVPVIQAPADGSVSTSSDNTVRGINAESGAAVGIHEGPTTWGSATADGQGRWSTVIAFSPGAHTIRPRAIKNTGGVVTKSEFGSPVTFTVDIAPVIALLNCADHADDIAEIQRVVGILTPGGTLELTGVCDFSPAAPARPAGSGSATPSPRRAGVLIQRSHITITAGAGGATIQGSGDENAFTLSPAANNVTIDGGSGSSRLTFSALGQPVRVMGADAVSLRNLVITGGMGTWAGLLAEPSAGGTVHFGADADDSGLGDLSASVASDGLLADLSLTGNDITFGTGSAGAAESVGIALVDASAGEIRDPRILSNTVRHQAIGAPGYLRHAGIRADMAQAVITGAQISSNTITGAPVGIVVEQADGFELLSNAVSVTERNSGQPEGAIVITDSVDGDVGRPGSGNSISVVNGPGVPPGERTTDLGAIGIVDDLVALSGTPGAPGPFPPTPGYPTTAIRARGNSINSGGRGILLNGTSEAIVASNTVSAAATALAIGRPVTGSRTGPGGPVTTTLPARAVSSSLLCLNTLTGSPATGYDAASGSTGSAFPGGGAFAGNVDCVPTLSLSPGVLNASSGDLTASGMAWPNRTVEVTITDSDPTTPGDSITRSGTAGSNGAYSIAFPKSGAQGWSTLDDSTISGVAVSSDPVAGSSAPSLIDTVLKDTGLPATPTIDTPLTNTFVPPDFTVSGSGPANHQLRLKDAGVTIATTTTSGTGAWSVALTGQSGTLALEAFTVDGSANESLPSNLVELIIDGTVPAPPLIQVPFEGEVVLTNLVTISGKAAPGHTVEVRKTSPGAVAFLGAPVATAGGDWSVTTTLADGIYEVSAIAINGVGTRSGPAVRGFRVKTDLQAPLVPTIDTPAEGSLQPTLVTISGRSEIGSIVTIREGTTTVGQAITQASGRYTMDVVMASGPHAIIAFATDGGGNVSPNSPVRSFVVDGTPPTIEITTPELTPFVGTPTIRGRATDNAGVSRVEVTVFDAFGNVAGRTEAALGAPGGAVTLWSATPDAGTGPFTVRAVAYDLAGNVSRSESILILVAGG